MLTQLMAGLGFRAGDESRPLTAFSGGWRMRLNLARTLMCRSNLLLLDEPTNHLDLDAVIWLEDWLSRYRGTLLLISHDRHFLNSVCTHMADLDYGELRIYPGNYDEYMTTLVDAYNPEAVKNVMCTNSISVSWDGGL